jgi:hypothetical protein
MLRFGAAGFSALLLSLALVPSAACVNPKTDYDDFLARTADADLNGITPDEAGFDGYSGDAGFMNQSYVMACVSQSFGDSVSDVILFYAEASFIPTDANGDGTFDFSDTALVVGATNTSQSAGGGPMPINGSMVTGGQVNVVYGPTTIPGSADPIGDGPIVFSSDTLHFYIGPGVNLCGLLSGATTEPLVTMLNPADNICIFFPFEGSTGTIPALTQAEFHCP